MKEVDVKKQTQRIMTLKWSLLVLLQYKIIVTSPSITGVTYMDHFDFEERYRDLNECNPFHWHPLHLPDYCAGVFEKLIRSRIASKTPVRVMRKKEKVKKPKDTIYSLNPKRTRYSYLGDSYDYPYPVYQMKSAEYESYSPPYGEELPMTPYEKVLDILKEDIKKEPSNPTVTIMPNLGPVALYNQAVSKKSVTMIRQLAEAFVKETKKAYDKYYASFPKSPIDHQLYVYDSAKNKTKTENINKYIMKDKKKEKKNKKEHKKNKHKVYRMKSKNGDVVTIVETKNLEMMRGLPFNNIETINTEQRNPKSEVELLEKK